MVRRSEERRSGFTIWASRLCRGHQWGCWIRCGVPPSITYGEETEQDTITDYPDGYTESFAYIIRAYSGYWSYSATKCGYGWSTAVGSE